MVVHSISPGFAENDWLGRILRVGDQLVLRVIARTPRCAVPTLAHGALPRDPGALRVLARHNRVEPVDWPIRSPALGSTPRCSGPAASVPVTRSGWPPKLRGG